LGLPVAEIRCGRSSARSAISRWAAILGENVVALIAGTLALAVYMCLATIDPTTWTVRTDEADHLRSELWNCLAIRDGAARVACYDVIAHQPPPNPARGANALPRAFGQEERWR
jgi:hypothetical protein